MTRAKIILAASILVLLAGCTFSPHVPTPPPFKQTTTHPTKAALDDETPVTIPAGVPVMLPDGKPATTSAPISTTIPAGTPITLPAGTEMEGGFGAVLWWLLAVGILVGAFWLAPKIVRRYRRKDAPP